MDKKWTDVLHGHNLDKVWILLPTLLPRSSRTRSGQIFDLDGHWTGIKIQTLVRGEITILDKLWTNYGRGQKVDRLFTWTNLGQCLVFIANPNTQVNHS